MQRLFLSVDMTGSTEFKARFTGQGSEGWLEIFRAFFQQRAYGLPATPFVHIALNVDKGTQAHLEQRIKDAKLEATYTLEHGYCRSVYITDPNGMIVEFTLDHPDVEKINATARTRAHSELKRWLAGDHTPNNTAYHRHQAA